MRLSILAFAFGVLVLQLQDALPSLATLLALAALSFVMLGFGLFGRQRGKQALILLGSAVLGFAWAGIRADWRLADELPPAWETRDIKIRGIIASLPQRSERGERFEFDVTEVLTPMAKVPRRILLSWYHGWDEGADSPEDRLARAVRPGERWQFVVRLKRPHGNANPGGFDYEAWLLERSIRATGTIRQLGAERLAAFEITPGYLVQRLRDQLRERFITALPEAPYLGVLIALAVGDQRAIPAAQWDVFNRTGVTHLVSISGLHMTMVAALFAGCLGWAWRRSERLMLWLPAQKAAVVAGWLAAVLYAALAGFEVPAQRTLYMLTVVALALWSGKNIGASRTLLIALGIVLLFDPWAVLMPGFWLSFGAVGVLFYVSAARLGVPSRWSEMVRQWGVTQWAVTVGSLPVLLLCFQQFSLVSPLANALAIPVVSLLVTPLALLFAVAPWPPLLQFDHWVMSLVMWCLERLAAWPVWQQAMPPLWASLLAAGGALWLLLPRGFPSRWVGVCLFLPLFTWSPPRPVSGDAWVDVLDVGQGLAVLVRTAEHALLFDTGPRFGPDANAGQRIVLPFLRNAGVDRLDMMMISHRDKDHAGGAESIREALPVARVLTSAAEFGGEPCRAGQSWVWDGVRFVILHPDETDYAKENVKSNSMSCVLRVEAFGRSLLLAADVEARDESRLVERFREILASDVLVVPHHGGRGSSSQKFVDAVDAREVVFSVGYRNAFGHPRPDIVARYSNSRTWRTDEEGAVRVSLSPDFAVSAWRYDHRRYWHGRVSVR